MARRAASRRARRPFVTRSKARVAVVGGGPAGLVAAEVLAGAGASVTVFDRMASVGRKFLLAGRGGLNLTHSEPFEAFVARYREAAPFLRAAIEAFPPAALRAWCEGLGQPSFVGTSGRVFPESFKASPLLRAWLRRLDDNGVAFAVRHRWTGWDPQGRLLFTRADARVIAVEAEAAVLALGGASWPRLGSDGGWTEILRAAGIAVAPLRPTNCGASVAWSTLFRERFEGAPLKRIALSCGGQTARGEAVVTRDGLEGGAVYALSGPLRAALDALGEARLTVDLRPDESAAALACRFGEGRGKRSLATVLRTRAHLAPVAVGLLQEAAARTGERLSDLDVATLAERVKAVPVHGVAMAPIEKAISSAGGVRLSELDARFMLKKRPGVFVAGEMLDWEAPTGGYLLQACFATGVAAARGVLDWNAAFPQQR